MILSEIEQYLSQCRRASLADLCNHFDTAPDAMRGMLGIWERKGKVRQLPLESACGEACCKCDPASIEIYDWVDD